jgi:hypothetical protein
VQPIMNEHPKVAVEHPQLIDFYTDNNSNWNIPILKTHKTFVSSCEETYTLMVVLWAMAVLFQPFLAKYHPSIPMSPLWKAVICTIYKTMICTRCNNCGIQFEVIKVIIIKNTDFWDVCPCSLAEI